MNKLVFILLSLAALGLSCGPRQNDAKQNESASPAAAPAQGPHFRFFEGATVKGMREKGNWCYEEYPEAVVLNADPVNSNRRLFGVGQGVYKVTLDLGSSANSFILRVNPGGEIELFTSDNYPLCLANRANFTIDADALGFAYDNGRMFKYAVELVVRQEGMYIAVDFTSGKNYGLTVRRCASCR